LGSAQAQLRELSEKLGAMAPGCVATTVRGGFTVAWQEMEQASRTELPESLRHLVQLAKAWFHGATARPLKVDDFDPVGSRTRDYNLDTLNQVAISTMLFCMVADTVKALLLNGKAPKDPGELWGALQSTAVTRAQAAERAAQDVLDRDKESPLVRWLLSRIKPPQSGPWTPDAAIDPSVKPLVDLTPDMLKRVNQNPKPASK